MANYKVVDADQLDADLKTVADAIREKVGTADELAFPDGMASAVEAIQAGGGDTQLSQFIEGTLTELYDEGATKVGSGVFRQTKIAKLSFPNVVETGTVAFSAAETTEFNLPKLKIGGGQTFNACGKIKHLYLPALEEVGEYFFYSCSALESVVLPSLKTTSGYMCAYSRLLNYIDFGSLKQYKLIGFSECYSLKTVVIRTPSLCTAERAPFTSGNNYHFFGTVNATYNPEGLKDGYIYVPRALVDSYKTATNWTTLATQFRALEDYTVDGTTTGAMDWDKINGGATE